MIDAQVKSDLLYTPTGDGSYRDGATKPASKLAYAVSLPAPAPRYFAATPDCATASRHARQWETTISKLDERVVPRQRVKAFPLPKTGCTTLCGLILALVGTIVFLAVAIVDPLELLQRPTESALRFTDRQFALHEAIEQTPDLQLSPLIRATLGALSPGDAADVLDEVQRFDGPSPDLLSCAAVFRFAGGDRPAGREAVAALRDYAPDVAETLEWIWLDAPEPDRAMRWTGAAGLACRNVLAAAADRRKSDDDAAENDDRKRREHGTALLARAKELTLVKLAILGLGVAIVVGWFAWGCRPLRMAQALVEDAWPPALGTAVLVRGLFWATVITLLLQAAGTAAEMPLAKVSMPALTAGLPLIGLIYYGLLRPQKCGLLRAFGLWMGPGRFLRAVVWAMPILAIDLSGRFIIDRAGSLTGLPRHWVERFAEDFVWSWDAQGLAVALNFVIFVPLVEEIAFRGVLYGTLRNRMGATSATFLSAAIFAAFQLAMAAFASFHLCTTFGLATAFWSGLVWAVAYERTRSLLPGLVAHVLANTLAVANTALIYGGQI